MKIGWVYVKPGIFSKNPKDIIVYRGKGYGKKMIKDFENYVKENYKDIVRIQLVPEYYSGNIESERVNCNLCDFYEKCGFKQLEDNNPLFIKIIK